MGKVRGNPIINVIHVLHLHLGGHNLLLFSGLLVLRVHAAIIIILISCILIIFVGLMSKHKPAALSGVADRL